MIAKPFSPGNAFAGDGGGARAHDVRQGANRIVHERQLRRSACRRRSSMRAAREAGSRRPSDGARRSFPGSGGVARQIERPDARLGGESIAEVFRVGRRRRSASRGAGPASARDPTRWQGPARDHLVQSQLAESHGGRRRRLPREPGGRRRLGARRLHGAARRAGAEVGRRRVRRLNAECVMQNA